jgi:hypothetical protein
MAQITTTREDAVETLVGTFRPPPGFELGDEIDLSSWRFHCPGCGTWGFLNAKQWAGQAKFNHKPDGCPGKYNEAHEFGQALTAVLSKYADLYPGLSVAAAAAQDARAAAEGHA